MNEDIRFYWKLLVRRSPVMLAFIIIGAGFGGVTAMKLPDEYSASSRLLVEAPQIPDELAASTVRLQAPEQLQIIEQRLLTRANLIDVANKFRVFRDEPGLSPDEVVEKMRAATRINRRSGREQATLMTINFSGPRAQMTANVVNEFTTLVLEANNEFRLSRAEGTLEFFEREVQKLGEDLDRNGAEVTEFRNENKDSLPESENYRRAQQNLLQERLSRLERELAARRKQREDILEVYENSGRLPGTAERQLSPDERRLRNLEAQRDELLAVLSETNPRVTTLQTRIDTLSQSVAEAAGQSTEDGEVSEAELALNIALAEIASVEEALESEIARGQIQLAEINALIDAAAANAIELGALERTYNNIETQYNNAVQKLNQARLGERIEVTSQGQRISVIENASVPNKPSGPNRPKVAWAGLGAGLGAALAFFVLLELLNRTIRRPAELSNRFQIIPIATIPYMESRGQRRLRRTAMATAIIAVLVGVPATLYYINEFYMPLDLLANRVISRLGLT